MHEWKIVSSERLKCVGLPESTDSYKPIPHDVVLDTAKETLVKSGYEVIDHTLALARQGGEFFATIDLTTTVSDTERLVVGLRNSHNKRFSIGFCVGTRTSVCSNLCFSNDVVINNRHTRHSASRHLEGIASAVSNLGAYQEVQSQRLDYLKGKEIGKGESESLILRAAEQGMIGWTALPKILAEWRSPSHDEHRLSSRYGLLQAFTQVLTARFEVQPRKAALETIQIQNFLAS